MPPAKYFSFNYGILQTFKKEILTHRHIFSHFFEFSGGQCQDPFMDDISPEFIERYQLIYEKNPKSKIFAPLSEAYRKMGLLKEALEVAQSGVSLHPDFAGGHVALGRIFIDQENWIEAARQFRTATELSPENILAQSTLAELLLRLKDPKGALKAFKMLLFLQPSNVKAQNAVKKLESLTADEYEADLFAMQPLKEAVRQRENTATPLIPLIEPSTKPFLDSTKLKTLERIISLADAFLVRNDLDQARQVLADAERQFGQHDEIMKRFNLLNPSSADNTNESSESISSSRPLKNRENQSKDEKVQFLKELLHHVSTSRESRI
jgi:tetratricopeptide (TPR) repeat protein